MTNTRGTTDDVQERAEFVADLLFQHKSKRFILEKLKSKYNKSIQTHRKDYLNGQNTSFLKRADTDKYERFKALQKAITFNALQNAEMCRESYALAYEKENVSVMVGACKALNSNNKMLIEHLRSDYMDEVWENEYEEDYKNKMKENNGNLHEAYPRKVNRLPGIDTSNLGLLSG